MIANPIHNSRALLIKAGKDKALVVSDLHLALEAELLSKGVSLPSQIPRVRERLIDLIKKKKPGRLIILGDVKHNIPISSWQEWREIPKFFEEISRLVQVEVVKGNHDGDLRGMVPESVKLHDAQGIVIGKKKRVGLVHGHAWPAPELFDTELLVTGHNHPAIEFRDKLGGRIVEPVWLKASITTSKLPKKIRENIKRAPTLLVIPAFSELVSGAPVNRHVPQDLIGPLFKSGAVDLKKAQIYLLDGTFLGNVAHLKKLSVRG